MTTVHFILRYAHIAMGLLALGAGAASMVLHKGSAWHRRAGQVFVVAMLIMAGSGAYISGYITPDMANVMAGLLTLYLVITAWATAWREPGRTGVLEICAAALGLTTATVGINSGLRALTSPTGLFDGLPAPFFFVFGGIALLGTALDGRMIARGGVTGAARTTRHLWRMLTAMWIATASFFLGQATVFPAAVRRSGALTIPVLLVLASLLYWLIKVRVAPLVRRSSIFRRAMAARDRPRSNKCLSSTNRSHPYTGTSARGEVQREEGAGGSATRPSGGTKCAISPGDCAQCHFGDDTPTRFG